LGRFSYYVAQVCNEEDRIGGTENYWKSSKLSHVFLVLFAVTSSTGAWDILMSIDAHWFSTFLDGILLLVCLSQQ
jgi:hypothetical protein